MASVFVSLRLTGDVTNSEARDLLARLHDLTEAFDAVGVDVRQSLDVRLDPETVELAHVAEAEPEPVAVVEDPPAEIVE